MHVRKQFVFFGFTKSIPRWQFPNILELLGTNPTPKILIDAVQLLIYRVKQRVQGDRLLLSTQRTERENISASGTEFTDRESKLLLSLRLLL